jgi:hypothetical protein
MRGFRPLAVMLGLMWLGIVTPAAHTNRRGEELTEGRPVRLGDALSPAVGPGHP